MDCPHGYEAHVGWSSRCKNCYRHRDEHSTNSLVSRNRRISAPTASPSHYDLPYRSPRSTTTVSPQPTLRRPSRTSWESDSKSRLTVVPSALTEARNYAPPEMHYQSSRTESVYATLPRTSYSRATAITTETYSSTSAAVSSYATLPRKTSMGGYKRVSPNEALLKRTPSTSSCAAPSASYLSPAARRRWSSVSTPVTPMLGSPAHTPRVRSPIRTYSPLPVVSPSRPYSSCGYYRSSRNSSQLTSPAFSRSTSRRSSIGHEDQVDSRLINRDPFPTITAAVSSTSENKYHSLPRNFSLQVPQQQPSPKPGSSDGIQRKYRRSHRQTIPSVDEVPAAAGLPCSHEGCANNNKSLKLSFSALVECWKCKQSSPTAGEYKLYEPQAPLAKAEEDEASFKTEPSVVFGNTLKTLRLRARQKSSSSERQLKEKDELLAEEDTTCSMKSTSKTLPLDSKATSKVDVEEADEEMRGAEKSETLDDSNHYQDDLTTTPESLLRLLNEDTVEFKRTEPSHYFSTYDDEMPTTMKDDHESGGSSSPASVTDAVFSTISSLPRDDDHSEVPAEPLASKTTSNSNDQADDIEKGSISATTNEMPLKRKKKKKLKMVDSQREQLPEATYLDPEQDIVLSPNPSSNVFLTDNPPLHSQHATHVSTTSNSTTNRLIETNDDINRSSPESSYVNVSKSEAAFDISSNVDSLKGGPKGIPYSLIAKSIDTSKPKMEPTAQGHIAPEWESVSFGAQRICTSSRVDDADLNEVVDKPLNLSKIEDLLRDESQETLSDNEATDKKDDIRESNALQQGVNSGQRSDVSGLVSNDNKDAHETYDIITEIDEQEDQSKELTNQSNSSYVLSKSEKVLSCQNTEENHAFDEDSIASATSSLSCDETIIEVLTAKSLDITEDHAENSPAPEETIGRFYDRRENSQPFDELKNVEMTKVHQEAVVEEAFTETEMEPCQESRPSVAEIDLEYENKVYSSNQVPGEISLTAEDMDDSLENHPTEVNLKDSYSQVEFENIDQTQWTTIEKSCDGSRKAPTAQKMSKEVGYEEKLKSDKAEIEIESNPFAMSPEIHDEENISNTNSDDLVANLLPENIIEELVDKKIVHMPKSDLFDGRSEEQKELDGVHYGSKLEETNCLEDVKQAEGKIKATDDGVTVAEKTCKFPPNMTFDDKTLCQTQTSDSSPDEITEAKSSDQYEICKNEQTLIRDLPATEMEANSERQVEDLVSDGIFKYNHDVESDNLFMDPKADGTEKDEIHRVSVSEYNDKADLQAVDLSTLCQTQASDSSHDEITEAKPSDQYEICKNEPTLMRRDLTATVLEASCEIIDEIKPMAVIQEIPCLQSQSFQDTIRSNESLSQIAHAGVEKVEDLVPDRIFKHDQDAKNDTLFTDPKTDGTEKDEIYRVHIPECDDKADLQAVDPSTISSIAADGIQTMNPDVCIEPVIAEQACGGKTLIHHSDFIQPQVNKHRAAIEGVTLWQNDVIKDQKGICQAPLIEIVAIGGKIEDQDKTTDIEAIPETAPESFSKDSTESSWEGTNVRCDESLSQIAHTGGERVDDPVPDGMFKYHHDTENETLFMDPKADGTEKDEVYKVFVTECNDKADLQAVDLSTISSIADEGTQTKNQTDICQVPFTEIVAIGGKMEDQDETTDLEAIPEAAPDTFMNTITDNTESSCEAMSSPIEMDNICMAPAYDCNQLSKIEPGGQSIRPTVAIGGNIEDQAETTDLEAIPENAPESFMYTTTDNMESSCEGTSSPIKMDNICMTPAYDCNQLSKIEPEGISIRPTNEFLSDGNADSVEGAMGFIQPKSDIMVAVTEEKSTKEEEGKQQIAVVDVGIFIKDQPLQNIISEVPFTTTAVEPTSKYEDDSLGDFLPSKNKAAPVTDVATKNISEVNTKEDNISELKGKIYDDIDDTNGMIGSKESSVIVDDTEKPLYKQEELMDASESCQSLNQAEIALAFAHGQSSSSVDKDTKRVLDTPPLTSEDSLNFVSQKANVQVEPPGSDTQQNEFSAMSLNKPQLCDNVDGFVNYSQHVKAMPSTIPSTTESEILSTFIADTFDCVNENACEVNVKTIFTTKDPGDDLHEGAAGPINDIIKESVKDGVCSSYEDERFSEQQHLDSSIELTPNEEAVGILTVSRSENELTTANIGSNGAVSSCTLNDPKEYPHKSIYPDIAVEPSSHDFSIISNEDTFSIHEDKLYDVQVASEPQYFEKNSEEVILKSDEMGGQFTDEVMTPTSNIVLDNYNKPSTTESNFSLKEPNNAISDMNAGSCKADYNVDDETDLTKGIDISIEVEPSHNCNIDTPKDASICDQTESSLPRNEVCQDMELAALDLEDSRLALDKPLYKGESDAEKLMVLSGNDKEPEVEIVAKASLSTLMECDDKLGDTSELTRMKVKPKVPAKKPGIMTKSLGVKLDAKDESKPTKEHLGSEDTKTSSEKTFQELLQEKRKLLTKYEPSKKSPEEETNDQSSPPEWMATRDSIIQRQSSGSKNSSPELASMTPLPATVIDRPLMNLDVTDDGRKEEILASLSEWGAPPPLILSDPHESSLLLMSTVDDQPLLSDTLQDISDRSDESNSSDDEDRLPSLVQASQPLTRHRSTPDLPLGQGCSLVCEVTASTETINSSELESLDSSTPVNMEPEKLAPVFNKLRRKEKSLRLKSQELENKLEMAETHCYALVEQNCDLKTAIESLETEILEVQDRFHDEDAVEWKRMRTEVKSMAKACRSFQLKLKKAEHQSGKLKAENAQLARSVSQDLRRRHQSHPPSTTQDSTALQPEGQHEMLKSAVIWGAVLVAGYQFLRSKMS